MAVFNLSLCAILGKRDQGSGVRDQGRRRRKVVSGQWLVVSDEDEEIDPQMTRISQMGFWFFSSALSVVKQNSFKTTEGAEERGGTKN